MADIHRFDHWSGTYEESWLQKRFFDPVHQAVLTLAANGPEPETILDIGCGTGRLLRKAISRWPYARLIGVDPAQGMVDVAQHLLPDAAFRIGTAEEIPLPDASVDLAMSTVSFHHWHDQAAGVREVARVLRPGGRFLLADASAPLWLSRLIRHARFPSAGEVRNMFTEAGLHVQTQQPATSRFVLITIGTRT